MHNYNILLDADKMPDMWYNIMPDMPVPMPPPLTPSHPQAGYPDDLAALGFKFTFEQEASVQQYISIPGDIMDATAVAFHLLRRAFRLEKALNTPREDAA